MALGVAPAGLGVVTAGNAAAVDGGRGMPGFCPDDNGVTVVVDFRELGGSTIVRCAPGGQATGLKALKNAGFRIAGTLRWGEGFICRIEEKPSPRSESCSDTPPASAYWSYWHAPNNGQWKYSEWGVANRTPPAGSFEGWSFSLNRGENGAPAPRVAPRRPSAPAPEPPRPPAPGSDSRPQPRPGDAQQPPAGPPRGNGGNGGGRSGDTGPGDGQEKPGNPGTAGGSSQPGAGASGEPERPGGGTAPSGSAPSASAAPGSGSSGTPSPAAGATEERTPGPRDTPTEAADWTGGDDSGKRVSADAPGTSSVGHSGGSGGVPTGTIVVAAAAAALAATASLTAWRRKRAARGDGAP
ncbi:hypothetical protein AC230_03955 [Streptomyces caatingaensis]|uniref:Flagellar hook-length control protein FliK n=1 Tax=Streptomyces caatingaensis TaxID=1678637 RepID=A0A0K9XMB6_9ACTN|nr:hypothetical protein AC230_03955 [Streptomyces caatingaensis]